MRIEASESTAFRRPVVCENGHRSEVWYIRTPDGVVMEWADGSHRTLPPDANAPEYVKGTCCFQAACQTAWGLGLHL